MFRLGDPICRYLDDCPSAWRAITIDQLIHHTSGIPDYEERLELGSDRYNAFMTRPQATAEIDEQARRDTLDFQPGTQFHYSNTGYDILARVIERAAGRPFATYMKSEILGPAGMKHSGVLGMGSPPPGLAHGYTAHGKPDWNAVLGAATLTDGHLTRVLPLALTPPTGDAFLYSTVDDLARWADLMDGGGFLSRDEIARAWNPRARGLWRGLVRGPGLRHAPRAPQWRPARVHVGLHPLSRRPRYHRDPVER